MSLSFDQIVKNFAPSWFAAVMGTGVLALGAAFLGHEFAPLAAASMFLHWFNIGLFLVLLVPWTLRWFRAPTHATGALSHPVVASFVPTVAIALLVLSVQITASASWPMACWPCSGA